jgi:ABC-2 type transport system permease protein
MSTQTNAASGSHAFATPATPPPHGPFYWSLRRELWENRSIYLGPAIAAGVSLAGFLVSLLFLPHHLRKAIPLGSEEQAHRIAQPYTFVAVLIMFVGIVVAIFYSLDAMQSERRDRSILFWKSLPVSDSTTVLAKISVPLVVLPVIVFVLIVALHLVMFTSSTVVLSASGIGASILWRNVPLFQLELVTLYGLIVHALWQAPLFAWLLFVSAWARRMAFLWALSPFLLLAIFSGMVLGNPRVSQILFFTFFGGCVRAFDLHSHNEFPDATIVTPGHLFGSPLLYFNLLLAAGLIFATIRLRRSQQPL